MAGLGDATGPKALFFDWLRPGPLTRRFIPAAGIGLVAVLVAFHRQLDLFAVAGAFVVTPVIASALNLLSLSVMRFVADPDAVALGVVEETVKRLPEQQKPLRRKARRALYDQARSILADQFSAFWTQVSNDDKLRAEIAGHEVRIVSLYFLQLLFLGLIVVPLFDLASTILVYVRIPISTMLSALLEITGLFVGFAVFSGGYLRSVNTFRRLLWERAPLLMISDEYLAPGYWEDYKAHLEEWRERAGPEETESALQDAEQRRKVSTRGERDRSWLARRVSPLFEAPTGNVRGAMDEAIAHQRDAASGRLVRLLPPLVAASGLIAASLAVTLQLPQRELLAAGVVTGILLFAVGWTILQVRDTRR